MQAKPGRKRIAVVGTGISGMAAAWLLNRNHDVTVYEQDRRTGGHSNTVTVPDRAGDLAVDTGFIVYNEATYPNLTALFDHLAVKTRATDMSFGVSLDEGSLEYSGGNLGGLLAQRRNMLRPRFWSMLRDVMRFYREAPRDLLSSNDDATVTLGGYLDAGRYGEAFRDDHLLPMAAAIWSAPVAAILDYPAASFVRFHDNHGLLQIRNRPQWRTVVGGSRAYVEALTSLYKNQIRLSAPVALIKRTDTDVLIKDRSGSVSAYDDVVIATHADQAMAILDDPGDDEKRLLGAFRYSRNRAVLHSDISLMPRRRAVWSSWNYLRADEHPPFVTYWMNALQGIESDAPLFVTINPPREPQGGLYSEIYDHPLFDTAAIAAQRELWSLQRRNKTWFCGAYFGAGFHEDGLQAGLAVAEDLGNVRRPWHVANESGRIFRLDTPNRPPQQDRAA